MEVSVSSRVALNPKTRIKPKGWGSDLQFSRKYYTTFDYGSSDDQSTASVWVAEADAACEPRALMLGQASADGSSEVEMGEIGQIRPFLWEFPFKTTNEKGVFCKIDEPK